MALVKVAEALSGRDIIYKLAVLDGVLYGAAGTDGALYAWNGTDAWTQMCTATYLVTDIVAYGGTIWGAQTEDAWTFKDRKSVV